MKKFSKLPVAQPNVEEIKENLKKLVTKLKAASSAEEAIAVVYEGLKYSDSIATNATIASIRHTIDTTEEKYEQLNDLYDEINPSIEESMQEFNHEIVKSKYKKELQEHLGKLFFNIVKQSEKTFKPEIIGDLQEENKLVSQYVKLRSSAQIDYKGNKYTLAQLAKFVQSLDREERKVTSGLINKFYEEHDEEFGKIYDDLVKVRTTIAKKLGYDNFVQLAYDRLGRLDYNAKDVKNYRDQVFENIVPLSNKLFKEQMERIDIKDPHYYDYTIMFKDGNPTPKGSTKELVKAAKKMYKQINKTACKYFTFMDKHELFDLEAKKGKAGGGYMTFIPDYKCSFVFSNFNGTSADVDVLTHEFGHALQGFLTADEQIPQYRSPTLEMCEVHSMSMEFFAYPYLKLFFKEDEKKYKVFHLSSAITFIPYGVAVDEFQQYVYENPKMTPKERKAKWREIEIKYLPHRQYGEDSKFLEEGGFWYRQSHIFEVPFYYIDYTIAQVLAFEFFVMSLKDYDKAFETYLSLDKLGGTMTFKNLIKAVNLKSPFTKGTLKEVTTPLEAYLTQSKTEL